MNKCGFSCFADVWQTLWKYIVVWLFTNGISGLLYPLLRPLQVCIFPFPQKRLLVSILHLMAGRTIKINSLKQRTSKNEDNIKRATFTTGFSWCWAWIRGILKISNMSRMECGSILWGGEEVKMVLCGTKSTVCSPSWWCHEVQAFRVSASRQ